MRRLAFLLFAALCFATLMTVSTAAEAQEYRPCCEGGFQPTKPCKNDNQCAGVCVGGSRDGKLCRSDSTCAAGCVGGSQEGNWCDSDNDCAAACVGGDNDGKWCDPANPELYCPGGTCTDLGTCSDPGTCDQGTCTALCKKGKPPVSPDDPVLDLPELELSPETEMVTHTEMCP
jgi:hypothetical protein